MQERQERFEQLRERAESFLARSSSKPELPTDAQLLVRELHVQQIELEFQNDELLQAQLGLQDSRDSYRRLFEEAPIGYVILDQEGRVLEANPAAAKLLLTELDALVDRRLQFFASNADCVRELNLHLEQALVSPESMESELPFRRSDGGAVHLRLLSLAVPGEPGQPPRCRTALIDVSAQKQTQDALLQVNKDLAERTRHLEASLLDIHLLEHRLVESQRLESVGRLAGGVAHDFNNMLMVINGVSQLALVELPPEHALRGSFERILLAGKRSAKLTSQLLAFGRRQLLAPEQVDLAVVLKETCLLLDTTLGPQVQVRLTPTSERVTAKADVAGLQQALVNLALNARDAMPEGGTLRMSLKNLEIDEEAAGLQPGASSGRYAVVSVRDDGLGLPAGSRERIFEPFFTTKEGGTGLGLASVHGYVSQSGGFVTVESAPFEGTTFHLHLPAVDLPLVHASGGSLESTPLPPLKGAVLLVDDEPLLRELFGKVLAKAGLEVVLAESAEEALRLCKERPQPVDLAIVDVLMPGMNGVELVQRLRELGFDFPVLYMSGFAAEHLVQRIGREVAGALLQKPLSPAELTKAVQQVLAP